MIRGEFELALKGVKTTHDTREALWSYCRSMTLHDFRGVLSSCSVAGKIRLLAVRQAARAVAQRGIARARREADRLHPCTCDGGVVLAKSAIGQLYTFACTDCLRAKAKRLSYPAWSGQEGYRLLENGVSA